MYGKLGLVMAVAVAALAAAGTALADGPVIVTQTLEATNVPWGPTCGSEAILASFTVTRRNENFYNGSTLVLQRRHVSGQGTITLPSTGETLPYEVNFNITTDFLTNTRVISGQQAHVLTPGGGIIFHNSGRLVEDITTFPPATLAEDGPHDYFDPGGTAAVCSALGA